MVETVIFDYTSPYCDFDIENGKTIFLHDTLAHDAASPYRVWLQKVQQLWRFDPDEHSLKFWTFAVTLTLNTTKQSNLFKIQSSSFHQTKFGYKRISSSEQIIESHNLTIWSLHCDCDLEDSKPVFSVWLMMMHRCTKFGSGGVSSSEDTVLTFQPRYNP